MSGSPVDFPHLVGGAPYSNKAASQRGLQNAPRLEGAAVFDKSSRIDAEIAKGGSLKSLYDELGYGVWDDLPGTLEEIAALGKANPGSLVLSGTGASEAAVKGLGASLAKYRRVHFATHGFAMADSPGLSALVLSQKDTGKEDGFLRVSELAALGFQTETITLSACETGLGKIFRGEGVYGLAQPLLEKAARRVNVSLWQVPDQATTQLMLTFYDRVNASEDVRALAEAKRKFAAGEFGEAWKHPYYWGAFVHYGP